MELWNQLRFIYSDIRQNNSNAILLFGEANQKSILTFSSKDIILAMIRNGGRRCDAAILLHFFRQCSSDLAVPINSTPPLKQVEYNEDRIGSNRIEAVAQSLRDNITMGERSIIVICRFRKNFLLFRIRNEHI